MYDIMLVEYMNNNKELEEALLRIKEEKNNPDFYNHYTDEKIKQLSDSIE